MDSLQKTAQILKGMDNVGIITHIYPDGDALGSAFSLCRGLQQIGKNACVLLSNPLPEKFAFMKDYILPQKFEIQYIVSVDLANNSLLEPSLGKYSSKIDMCIDHHVSNRGFSEISYVDSSAAANCEIIYDLLKLMGVLIDKKTAEGLYIGISTDTGCFKYSNTTYKSHKIAAELMQKGIKISEINEKLFTVRSRKMMEIEKTIYKNMKFFLDGKCAVTFITLDDIKKHSVADDECEGIASIPIKTEGVLLGITLREKTPENYKVSVRTSGNTDANKFASLFGGGGHFKASGFNISGSINNVIKQILTTAELELEKQK